MYSSPISYDLSRVFTCDHNIIDLLRAPGMPHGMIIYENMLTGTNLQINVISSKVGYTDPKYFCTIFKKQTGLTPNQYRKTISSE